MINKPLRLIIFLSIGSICAAEISLDELKKKLTETQIAEYQSAGSADEKKDIFKKYLEQNQAGAEKIGELLEDFVIFENLRKEVQAEKKNQSLSTVPLLTICSFLETCNPTTCEESPSSSPVTPNSKLVMGNTTDWRRNKEKIRKTPTTGSALPSIAE